MVFEETVYLPLRVNQEKNKLWKCYATVLSCYAYTEHIFRLVSNSYYKKMGRDSVLLLFTRSLKHMQSFDFIPKP